MCGPGDAPDFDVRPSPEQERGRAHFKRMNNICSMEVDRVPGRHRHEQFPSPCKSHRIS